MSGKIIKNMQWLVVMLFLLTGVHAVSSEPPPRAVNIHVSPDGSDETGDGSIASPFATLQKANEVVQPGDTVFVHAGTYRNTDFDDGDIWEGGTMTSITTSGTEDAWIVYMPYPGDSVLLEFDGAYGVVFNNVAYVKFTGFEVKGIADKITLEEAESAWGLYKDENGVIHDLAEEMGIDITDPALWGQKLDKPNTENASKPSYYNGRALVAISSYYILIENNVVRDVPSAAIRVQKSDYVTVRGNTVYHNTYWTTLGVGAITVAESTVRPVGDTFDGVKIILENNIVHHNENRMYSWNPNKDFVKFVIDEGTGLFLTRNNDTYDHGYILIANNLSYLNGASGIVVHKTNRAIVEQNTLYDNGTTNGDAKAGGIGLNTCDDVTIYNNISWSKPDKIALGILANPVTNTKVDANILFNNNGPQDVVSGIPDGWTETDPMLMDPAGFDFRLQKNSPAINNGNPDILVTTDIVGFPRDDKPDIGAYEYDPAQGTDEFYSAKKSKLSVYPNPVKDVLFISSDGEDLKTLKMFDLSGKEYPVVPNHTAKYRATVDFQAFPPGVYILKTKTAAARVVKN